MIIRLCFSFGSGFDFIIRNNEFNFKMIRFNESILQKYLLFRFDDVYTIKNCTSFRWPRYQPWFQWCILIKIHLEYTIKMGRQPVMQLSTVPTAAGSVHCARRSPVSQQACVFCLRAVTVRGTWIHTFWRRSTVGSRRCLNFFKIHSASTASCARSGHHWVVHKLSGRFGRINCTLANDYIPFGPN